jgi:uncharacterized protein YcnI
VITLALTVVLLVVLGWLFGAGVADASVTVVTVDPPTAEAGGTLITLTFRVPSQANTATVGFSLSLPADHPFAEVTPQPSPGWSAATTTTSTTLGGPVTLGGTRVTGVVTSVTWTAAPGAGVGPGGSAEFTITAGPVPAVDALRFPATQSYDNGTVIRWDEPSSDGGRETLHPAPTLTITEPGAATAGGTTPTDSPDHRVTVVAVVGVLVVAAITAAAVLARRRRRGRPSAPTP